MEKLIHNALSFSTWIVGQFVLCIRTASSLQSLGCFTCAEGRRSYERDHEEHGKENGLPAPDFLVKRASC